MQNIDIKIKDKILTITCDLSKRFGKSASGKTTIVASTQGNVAVGDSGVILGLNAYTKGE
jgi:hypothetical protein